MIFMKVIIAGASGLVGSKVLNHLLNENKVEQVYSIGRKILNIQSSKLMQIQISDFAQLPNETYPAEVAICSLGTTIKVAGSKENFYKIDHDAVIHFANYCKKIGVKKFIVVSATGSNSKSKIFYNRVKGEMERDLKLISFESLIILRPGLLLGERVVSRPLETISIKAIRALEFLLPNVLINRAATDIKHLSKRLISLVISDSRSNIEIIDSSYI